MGTVNILDLDKSKLSISYIVQRHIEAGIDNFINQSFVNHPKSEVLPDKTNSNNNDNPIRQFTEEQKDILKSYFIAPFKGSGNNINYFDENLVIDLKKNRVGIEYAKIAKLIYESPKSVKRFKDKPFTQWYETFCSIMQIEVKKYKPSTIKIDDKIKNEFYYLT